MSSQLKDTLPFFNTAGTATRIVPQTIDEVPFNQPFRATFTLEHYREGDKTYLYAELVTLDTI